MRFIIQQKGRGGGFEIQQKGVGVRGCKIQQKGGGGVGFEIQQKGGGSCAIIQQKGGCVLQNPRTRGGGGFEIRKRVGWASKSTKEVVGRGF